MVTSRLPRHGEAVPLPVYEGVGGDFPIPRFSKGPEVAEAIGGRPSRIGRPPVGRLRKGGAMNPLVALFGPARDQAVQARERDGVGHARPKVLADIGHRPFDLSLVT